MKKKILSLVAILLMAMPVAVQATDFSDSLVTDRPDTAESSLTVGQGRFQIESGLFNFTQDRHAGVTTKTFNFPTLFRYGVFEDVEFRVEGDLLQIQTATHAARVTQFTDTDVGFKAHLVDPSETNPWVPSMGVLVHLTVPTGGNTFSSNTFEPTVKFANDWEIVYGFSIGTNVGFTVPVQDAVGDKYAVFLYAAALGHAMPWSADRWGAYAELSGEVPTVSGKFQQHTVDAGFTFLITPDLQIDTFAALGLNDQTDDIGVGFGISWRAL